MVMKILLFTKEDQVERLGFAVRDYREHILPFVGLTKQDRNNLDNIDYDVGLGFLYPYKIPAKHVNKWINFHPGLLPDYGGRNVAYHAIMNREKHFGGTVHYMDENFDTGDVISIRAFFVQDHFTAGDLNEKAIDCLYAELDWLIYRLVENIPLPRIKQEKTRYFPPTPLDDEIDLDYWVEKRIRALTTKKFSAKIFVNGRKYKVITDE